MSQKTGLYASTERKRALFAVIDAGPINGRYEVEDIIDEGGMGLVFRAMDLGLKRRVALKVYVGDFDTEENLDIAYDLYLREARLAASLNHPNIVAAYDLGIVEASPDRNPFFAMEYIQGKTLADLTRQQTLSLPELLQIFLQVGRALDFAHRQSTPVLHRDVKPRNILVGEGGVHNGRVVLIDFGFSKLMDGTATAMGVFKGSATYMAPELLRAYFGNDPQEIAAANHPKADLYSFGATIYRVLTGSNPVPGQSAFEVLQALPHAKVLPPSQVSKQLSLPPQLDDLVLRLFAKEPQQRLSSAAAAVEQLRNLLRELAPIGLDNIDSVPQIEQHQAHLDDVEQLLKLRRLRTRPSLEPKRRASLLQSITQSGVLISLALVVAFWIFKPRLLTPPIETMATVAPQPQPPIDTKTAVAKNKSQTPPARRRVDERMLIWKEEGSAYKQEASRWGVPSGTIIQDLYLMHALVSQQIGSPVRAKLRRPFTLADKTILPRDTVFVGEATHQADSNRVNIQFHQANTPNGTEIPLDATALMPDGSNGLIAKTAEKGNNTLSLDSYTPMQVFVRRGF